MAAVTTTGAGNWSSGSSVFSGGSGVGGVPTNADTVTITHAITLDTTAAVADSVVINAGGSLVAQTAGDSKLIVDKTISTATNSTAVVTLDVSSVPQYKCEIYCNADTGSNANGITLSGDFDLKGAPKTAYTYVSGSLSIGATSCTVDDATGWRQGDKIVFCTTQAYNSTPRVDVVTLNGSYTNGSTSLTWTGGLTYAHDDNCIAGNFTRNLIIGPSSGSNADSCSLTLDLSSRATAAIIRDVEFRNCRQSSAGSGGVFRAQSSAAAQTLAELSNCAFYEWQGTAALWTNAAMGTTQTGVLRTNNIFYSTTASTVAVSTGALSGSSIGDEHGLMVFRAATGISTLPHGAKFVDAKLSGCTTAAVSAVGTFPDYAFTTSGVYGGSGIWSCNAAVALAQTNSATIRLNTVRLGLGPHATNANYSSANNANLIAPGSGLYDVEFYNCDENISGGALMNAAPSLQTQRFKFLNRDLSLDSQEIYQNSSSSVASHSKSVVAAELTRSTSSLVMTWTGTAGYLRDYVVSVPAKAGTAIRILIYVAKSATNSPVSGDVAYGASTLPYATLSGLGITPVTVTLDTDSVAGYSSGVFELMAIDLPAASAPASDGELTLTLVGQSAVSGAQCYWAGIPIAPFITRCRHYGYLFDETSLTRTRNYAVTVSAADTDLPTPTELVASETTAAGIGGITISWGTTSSITAFAADKTFQELYDYTQAQACLNVGSAVALTGVGVAGSPALFAAGNVTISTGKVLNGSGSLSMGSYTLSTEFSSGSNYTYTGGTWAQALTTPSFSGGTLNIGAAGVYVFDTSGTIVINMTPTGASPPNYDLDSITANGVVDLRNTTAHAITVELSSAVAALAITSNNTGGTITVTAPVVTADISITGMLDTVGANARLQIINQTAAAAASRANSTAYSAGDVRLRQTGAGSENTAGLYLRCTTSGISDASPPTWNTTVGGTTTDGTVVWTTYAILYYHADPAATSFADTYIDGEEFLAGETIEIRFAEEDPAVSFKTYSTSVIATAAGFSALVSASADSVYATYGLSGAAQDSVFSPNFVANYIVLDANINFAGSSAYAYYCYLLTTDDGMYRFWGGLTGIDPGNIRNNVSVISLYFDETAGFVRQTDDVRIFRSDGARPALDPTTGGAGIEINWKVPVNVVTTGGSALTTDEHNALMALPSAAVIANEVVNVVTFP